MITEIYYLGYISFINLLIHAQAYDKKNFIDTSVFNQMYDELEKSIHTQYIGEITNVWIKK